MKIVVLATVAVLTLGAADPEPGAAAGELSNDARAIYMPNVHTLREAACRDRITQARAERGLPKLERETASPDKPLLITALDHRIDGCGVLVMRHDTSDIRPVPVIAGDQPLVMPAR